MTRRKSKHQRGQGMTEYIIIVALIAIGTIAVVTVFGDNIRALFAASTDALAGQNSGVQTNTFGGDVQKDMKSFADPP